MATRISATELSRRLSDILNRVYYRHESFTVERNGEVVATIDPPAERQDATLATLAEILQAFPLDEGFADDLEDIQRNQPPIGDLSWPD